MARYLLLDGSAAFARDGQQRAARAVGTGERPTVDRRRPSDLTAGRTNAILCPTVSTIRLFDKDPYRRSFRARVVQRLTRDTRPSVVLDRTCFYPASGGQPADRGEIDGVPVLDVGEQDGAIVHVLAAALPRQRVAGQI